MPDFAIAAGHELTAAACEDILRAGGSAVDAAIGGALTACVAEPVLAGLLGGVVSALVAVAPALTTPGTEVPYAALRWTLFVVLLSGAPSGARVWHG